MNVDDKAKEPVNNLDLSFGHPNPNQFIQRKAKNESGADAIAGSALDMTFVATDPLSEVVWSPQTGLSLRCADGSFSKKKFSLLCDAGLSNVASGLNANEPINPENFMTSAAACNVTRDSSIGFPANDAGTMPLSASVGQLNAGEDICTVMNFEVAEKLEGRENKISRFPDEPKLDVAQNDPISEEPIVRVEVCNTEDTLRMEIDLTSHVHPEKQCEAYDARMQNVLYSGKGLEELPSSVEKESKEDVDLVPLSIFPPEKLESSDENDLRALLSENACCATTKIVAAESADEVGDNSQQDSKILCGDKSLEANLSPTNSRILRYQMKGKAKALSDGNVNGRVPDDEDNSHESVESCNTTRVISTGKRRLSFEQQLIVGSKRVKRQIHESPSSTTYVKKDSSFMNWISNMMKGVAKSNENTARSPALTLEVLNHGRGSPRQNSIICNRSHDPHCKDIGFRSIFRSLYCPKTRATFNANYQTNGSKDLKLDTEVCDIHATPIACRTLTGSFYKRFQLLTEKFNESASGYGTGSMPQPKDTSINYPSIPKIHRSGSAEKQISHDYSPGKDRKGTSSNYCRGKRKRDSGEKADSESLSEGKTSNNFVNKVDPLASLWVTRFTPKSCSPLSNQDLWNKSTGEAPNSSIDGMKLKSQLDNHLRSGDGQKIMEGRKHLAKDSLHVQTFVTSADSSFGISNIKGQHDEKSLCYMEPILSSLQLENSEVMASAFARRLDALKQIIPSNVINIAACASMTCFFCGGKGHNLQNCRKASSSELEDVFRNISSHNGAEEFPCLCIRCFQLDHWAVACPNASSRMREEEHGALDDECAHKNLQHGARGDTRRGTDHRFKWRSDEAAASGKLEGNARLFEKGIASSFMENKLKENKIMGFCEFPDKTILNVPKGVIDSLKMLQLSRTDVLKWMNSRMPLSHLDGLFLRLRLGKWEEGLGGTGYNVACINGVERESSPQNSKNYIGVNVGRIKCSVESKYISNHDFCEDEIIAWWSTTLKAGGKMPSEEYLRLKVKEKQMLGF